MIPEWLLNGDLPPGVYFVTWRVIENRLNFNLRRRRLLDGFRRACEELRKAGCRLVYLDGSFVTRKEHPGDFDGATGKAFMDFFRVNKRTGEPKGILAIRLRGGRRQ